MIRLTTFGASTALHGAVLGAIVAFGLWGFDRQAPVVAVSEVPTVPLVVELAREAPPEVEFTPEPLRSTSLVPDEVKPVFEELQDPRPLPEPEPLPPKAAPPAPSLDRPVRLSAAAQKVDPPAPSVETETPAAEFHNPPPQYPPAARRRGLEGEVVLEITILADGRCGEAKVAECAGSALFSDAALDAVRTWSYVPAMRAGVAVTSTQRVRFVFKLRS